MWVIIPAFLCFAKFISTSSIYMNNFSYSSAWYPWHCNNRAVKSSWRIWVKSLGIWPPHNEAKNALCVCFGGGLYKPMQLPLCLWGNPVLYGQICWHLTTIKAKKHTLCVHLLRYTVQPHLCGLNPSVKFTAICQTITSNTFLWK